MFPRRLSPTLPRRGFTMFELLTVLTVLAGLTALVVMPTDELRESSQRTITEQTLLEVRRSIVGGSGHGGLDQCGYRTDVGVWPLFVADLFQPPLTLGNQPQLATELQHYDPIAKRGWRGPYLLDVGGKYQSVVEKGFFNQYGNDGWPAALDAWCRPIVLQWPTLGNVDPTPYGRLVSAGANGVLETSPLVAYPARATCGDDLVLYLNSADLRPD